MTSGPGQTTDLASTARRFGYRNPRRYQTRADFIFEGVPLEGARVLDVGAGPGTFTIWPALNGAEHVLGIEPEVDGSTAGTLATLQKTIDDAGLSGRIDARADFLNDVTPADGPFDVVVTYNVVNHLDEDATMRLPGDPEAERRYVGIFKHIASLMRPGGVLIVADCARSNGWAKRGRVSPFATTIEWEKHLDPGDWQSLLEAAGFELIDLRWSYLYPFRRLTSNRFVQYWTASHFVLRVRLPR